MISGFLKVQVGTLENEHVVRAVGENSVSRLEGEELSLIHISEPTRLILLSRMPSSA